MRRLLLVTAALAATASTAVPASAATTYQVTYAARVCPAYTDVTANLARNNIMESLQDLGPDTPYVSGQPVDPEIEADNQSKCTPIIGWRLTLGTGIGAQVKGPWGALSPVTGAFPTPIVTRA